MYFEQITDCSRMLYFDLTNISRMLFNHRTCAGQQTGAKPRPQEPVDQSFVNLSAAAQQDL